MSDELVHVDIKKPSRIPNGGGDRMLEGMTENRQNRDRRSGY